MFNLELQKKTQNKLFNTLATYEGVIVYGVPRETANNRRYDQKNLDKPEYNNAELLALMESGSIINKMPERKLLVPVRRKYKKQIDDSLLHICRLLLHGEEDRANLEMERLALRIETWTKKFFTDPDNGWAPNAPITINGGWMRNKVSGKPVYIKGKHSNRPLIDTGELRKSIRAIFYKGGKQ